MLLLLQMIITTTTCIPASDERSPVDRFTNLRSSGLNVASWINLGMQTETKPDASREASEVCVDSGIMRLLLRQITAEETEAKDSVDLRALTDEQLKVLCQILCG